MGKDRSNLNYSNLFAEYNFFFYAVENIASLDSALRVDPFKHLNPYFNYHFRLVQGKEVDIILTNRSEELDREELSSLFTWFSKRVSEDNSQKLVFLQENGFAVEWQGIKAIGRVYT